MIQEFETGGRSSYNRNPHPEAPDARFSGITAGIGYDFSTVSVTVGRADWLEGLGDTNASRLAATHPWTGRTAQANLYRVKDILVEWNIALGVFNTVDVARTLSQCRRTFPGFDDLSGNCQAAIASLVFNRGASLAGPNRTEMRAIAGLATSQNYPAIAVQFRKMVRVWAGTSIYNGMKRRRYAEADLVVAPDL